MRYLVTGATGKIGEHVLRLLADRGDGDVVGWSRHRGGVHLGATLRQVELADEASIGVAFREARPDVVIHLAAQSTIARVASDAGAARRANVRASEALASLAADGGARMLFASTDMVFDGDSAPYAEDAPPGPRSEYGRTKAAAEEAVLARGHAVARLSLVVGPAISPRNAGFFEQQVRAFQEGSSIPLIEDEWRTPIAIDDAARGLVDLATCAERGVFHLGGPERLSRLEIGLQIANALGLDPSAARAIRRADLPGGAERPRDLSLRSDRWRALVPQGPWRRLRDAQAR